MFRVASLLKERKKEREREKERKNKTKHVGLAIAKNKNAIVASCWTYFTTIKHDARNHKY